MLNEKLPIDKLMATPYDFLFLEYLFEQPIVTVHMVEQRLNCALVTANKVVERFVKLGLLDEMKGFQRNHCFRHAPYLALFEPARQAGPAVSEPGNVGGAERHPGDAE